MRQFLSRGLVSLASGGVGGRTLERRGPTASPDGADVTRVPVELAAYAMFETSSTEPVDGEQSSKRCRVSVDGRDTYAASPIFLSWVARLQADGYEVEVSKLSPQEFEKLRGGAVAEENPLDSRYGSLPLAQRLFQLVAAVRSSDLHVSVRERLAEVEVRIDGSLRTSEKFSMYAPEGDQLVRAIWNGLCIGKDSPFAEREFQDALVSGERLPGTGISNVRVIRGPIEPVEKGCHFLAARFNYYGTGPLDASRISASDAFRELDLRMPAGPEGEFHINGYTDQQHAMLDRLIRLPEGLVFFTGPTGSGKTSALNRCMRRQAQLFPDRRQITMEDPPETPYPWAWTFGVNKAHSFYQLLMYSLRADPDIMLFGETRYPKDALAVVRAVMTGHMVWSTLHEKDPFKIFTNLENLDPENLSLAKIADHELIVGGVGQRLVRTICDHCKRPLRDQADRVPAYMREILSSWEALAGAYVAGDGCEHCRHMGYTGRIAVAEVIETTEELMADIRGHGVPEARRRHRLRVGSDKSMLAHVMDHIRSGRVDPTDAHGSIPLRTHREGL
ncbi:ATPase, T2SS/T4P/T4SS family [Burkholderia cenocepacia]|uniref:ATPase, T2SS/T4P/T4SS family n=1 Tax=Burkholderia cenocepacia TaxID=95486 RepID=UPI002230BD65|nr:ATPase, T2SS/T4P/T4SS family [Burkholderia cenocepacia]MCW3677831.1 Flp pilus assembly complex ATPase component TadA [Burkholderia cenocepacia]